MPLAWTLFPASFLAPCPRADPVPLPPTSLSHGSQDKVSDLQPGGPSWLCLSSAFLPAFSCLGMNRRCFPWKKSVLVPFFFLLPYLVYSCVRVHKELPASSQMCSVVLCGRAVDYRAFLHCPGNCRPAWVSPCFAQSGSSRAVLTCTWDLICTRLW